MPEATETTPGDSKPATVIDVKTIPRMSLNPFHALHSPTFWFLAGAASAVALYFFVVHKRR